MNIDKVRALMELTRNITILDGYMNWCQTDEAIAQYEDIQSQILEYNTLFGCNIRNDLLDDEITTLEHSKNAIKGDIK